MADEGMMEGARRAARGSVLNDLSRDVSALARTTEALNRSVTESNKRSQRRFMVYSAFTGMVTLLLIGLTVQYAQLRGLEADLRAEVQARAVSNCEAILTSRDVLADIIELVDQPDPTATEGMTQEERDDYERRVQRSRQFFEQALSILNDVECEPNSLIDPHPQGMSRAAMRLVILRGLHTP